MKIPNSNNISEIKPEFSSITAALKDKILSKSLWGSFLLAIVLWVFVSLNDIYTININVPLTYSIPSNRAFAHQFPKIGSFQFNGNGWSLFNLKYFNSAKICNIDLKNLSAQTEEFVIDRTTLLKSLEFTGNTNAVEVYPNSIPIKLGFNAEKKVKVNSKIQFIANDNFVLVGTQEIIPNEVTIYGNTKQIDSVNSWDTKKVRFSDLTNDFNETIPLEISESRIINLKSQFVQVKQKVEYMLEQEIADIPINVIGELPKSHKLYPEIISIKVRGGLNQVSSENTQNIKVTLESKEIISDKFGYLNPQITLPKGIVLVDYYPKFIKHVIER